MTFYAHNVNISNTVNYADGLASRIEKTHNKLPKEVDTHLARSCFAALIMDAYSNARADSVPYKDFESTVQSVIDFTGLRIFDKEDTLNTLPGKRQPSLRESVSATVDRFETLDRLENAFSDSATSIVYGGSMKYGPFMNVRSGADSSDIDLIVVTEKEVLDEANWHGLMETSLIDERDKLTFFARFSLQRSLHEARKVDIMSQRFTVSDKGYTISAHFIPENFVENILPQSEGSINSQLDRHKYIRDYKERPFERPQVTNYDMSRRQHSIPVYNKPVEGGFIAANPAYSIIENRYVPGMYQNLVLPDFRYVYDQNGKTLNKVDNFINVMKLQEVSERQLDANATIENTEPRKPILPLKVDDII